VSGYRSLNPEVAAIPGKERLRSRGRNPVLLVVFLVGEGGEREDKRGKNCLFLLLWP